MGLDTMIYILVLVYALVRWGSGREIVIGLAVVAVAAGIGTVADCTGPADVIGGFAILAAAADGAAFRYRAESWRRALDQSRSLERVGLARELTGIYRNAHRRHEPHVHDPLQDLNRSSPQVLNGRGISRQSAGHT